MTINPVSDYVLIKKIVDEKTESGIILPSDAPTNLSEKGLVVKTGPGRVEAGNRIPVGFSAGETVILSKFLMGQEIKEGAESYLLIRESDIIAVVSEESLPVVTGEVL